MNNKKTPPIVRRGVVQITNLELSKKLKKLGVKQDSLHYWTPYLIDIGGRDVLKYQIGNSPIAKTGVFAQPFYNDVDNYSAFTVSELGLLLPQNFDYDGKNWTWSSYLSINGWNVQYENMDDDTDLIEVSDINEANARAKLLICLLEDEYITTS